MFQDLISMICVFKDSHYLKHIETHILPIDKRRDRGKKLPYQFFSIESGKVKGLFCSFQFRVIPIHALRGLKLLCFRKTEALELFAGLLFLPTSAMVI